MTQSTANPIWCGLCVEYTDHDTGHHGTIGFARGDIVSENGEVGRSGRVEEVRGKRARVAWRGKHGRTETEWADADGLKLVP